MEAVTGVASLYFRGLFLAELGRDREAVEAFRAYRRAPDLPDAETYFNRFLAVSSYARSLYHEAAALDRLGEREEARRAVDRLLRLWDRADPDLPLLAEARALRQRLAAEGAAR
jgi:tetratricopeptide (TPR) repeat protein